MSILYKPVLVYVSFSQAACYLTGVLKLLALAMDQDDRAVMILKVPFAPPSGTKEKCEFINHYSSVA